MDGWVGGGSIVDRGAPGYGRRLAGGEKAGWWKGRILRAYQERVIAEERTQAPPPARTTHARASACKQPSGAYRVRNGVRCRDIRHGFGLFGVLIGLGAGVGVRDGLKEKG